MTGTNQPWSFASPMGGGMVMAEIVSINSADNSVQVRVHGYQDDKGNIPDDKLEWVKVLSGHAGLAGATGTHNFYPGAKVMLGMSGMEKFVMGAVTGYDSDKSNKQEGADSSENQDPNVPRIVRGPKPSGNRDIEVGTGEDKTAKGTRNVQKTNKPFDEEQAQKVFDYAKQIAPFDKGPQSKFPDLKSIGIDKLAQGSNVLDTIDGMDGNISGAIQAGTKIIRNMERGGFGDAMSLLNGGGGGSGGAADQGTQQVVDYHKNTQLMELLAALKQLLAAQKLVLGSSVNSKTSDLNAVPHALQYTVFGVDVAMLASIQAHVVSLDTALTGDAKLSLVTSLKSSFSLAFTQAMTNAVTYVAGLVNQPGGVAVLVAGTTDFNTLIELLGTLQASATAAGMPETIVSGIGGGMVGQLLNQGVTALNGIMSQAQGVMGQIQKMMQDMNTFGNEMNAMSEIMGGGASIQESLTNITMKFKKKIENFDGKGFTK